MYSNTWNHLSVCKKNELRLSKFLRWSLMLFIIKGFWTIVFIFIVISTTFRLICPLAFFRYLSNSGTFAELWTTSFIGSTGVTCSDFISHNQVQVLSIPVLLLACSQDWTCDFLMIVSLEAWESMPITVRLSSRTHSVMVIGVDSLSF